MALQGGVRYYRFMSTVAGKRKYNGVKNFESERNTPKILITGGLGQLGGDCAKMFRSLYGAENVILSDIVKPNQSVLSSGPFLFADILDVNGLRNIIITHKVDWIIHFSALLSVLAEENIFQALKVNIDGLHNVMNLALQYNLRIFVPSSIAAFGKSSPRFLTPNDTIQRPNTIHGVGKVHAELLGEYYNYKYGLDFRCLRFPGVISYGIPGGGTTADTWPQVIDDSEAGQDWLWKHKINIKTLTQIMIEKCMDGYKERAATMPLV